MNSELTAAEELRLTDLLGIDDRVPMYRASDPDRQRFWDETTSVGALFAWLSNHDEVIQASVEVLRPFLDNPPDHRYQPYRATVWIKRRLRAWGNLPYSARAQTARIALARAIFLIDEKVALARTQEQEEVRHERSTE